MTRFALALLLLGAAMPLAAQTPDSRGAPQTVLPDHNGGIVANGPGGATSVTPNNRDGGGTINGRDGTTYLVPNGVGGFTAYGPSRAGRGLRETGPIEPRELLGGTVPPRGESLRGDRPGLR
jgi:hypothetical protein